MTLRIQGVDHRYRARGGVVDALAGIDLTIRPGELVCVVGPSGCGKTTLLKLVAGFLRPSRGTIDLDGEEIAGPGPDRGVVFQQPNLFPWMTVAENVALGPRLRGVGRAARVALARRHLAAVGLAGFEDAAPYELSGGMQQRAQIARVLAADARILLLDEPFGALDALTRERLQDELLRIWEGTTKAGLFITHSVEEAVYLGTRVLVLGPRPGRVVFDEPVPFGPDERRRALRTTPAFSAFRQRVADQIRAT